MNELLKKYLDNQITNQEFDEFRKLVNASTDNDIEHLLEKTWINSKSKPLSQETASDIKNRIDEQADQHYNRRNRSIVWQGIIRIAAIVTIPLMLLTTYLYFSGGRNEAANDMIVAVAEGEKASITLPDGTKASLNAQTELSYDVTEFNKTERKISLKGEAYFEVAKNKNKPFIIRTAYMDVKVLGTTFNLLARDEDSCVELDLKEGKVNIRSNVNSDEVILYPNEKAILDKKTGKINVIKSDPELALAWTRGEMVFRATSLHNIFREIERSFGVKIEAQCPDSLMNDLFTGTFATDNLNETLKILKMHYKFNYSIEGKVVKIENH